MRARIYLPAKTATQSGRGNTTKWIVEYEPRAARTHDSLMGWTSSSDTGQQVRLRFETKEEAIAYCRRADIDYIVCEPRKRPIRPKNYADNFRTDRVTG
ncbi:MAG: ETC complex I subunit [Rhodospirillaceae bacterium]|nr:ETC complex I subunit [Rhodospirillaceae bacterium]MCY4236761.1 ETC complex I subunit [Rhodospirillaceae bacterium]